MAGNWELTLVMRKKQYPRSFPPHQTHKKGSIGSIVSLGSIGSWPSSVQHLHETEGILWHPRHSCESPQHKAQRPQETDQDSGQRNGTTMEAQQHTQDLRKFCRGVMVLFRPNKVSMESMGPMGVNHQHQCRCHRVDHFVRCIGKCSKADRTWRCSNI